MKRSTALLAVVVVIALAACASTPEKIVGPSRDAQGQAVQPSAPLPTGIAADLQNAAWNLDQAISIGVLRADDPADGCAHAALRQAGIEVPPGTTPSQSFVPRGGDVLAKASVLYIIAKQEGQGPGFTVDTPCKALLGQMVIDGLGAANKLLPGQVFSNLVK